MKVIKCLAKSIHKELHCACDCANKAMHYKESNKEVGDAYYLIANNHLENVTRLHQVVINVIKATDSTSIPAVMQSIWEFEHDMMIEEEAEIKAILALYK